jgi:hypothetical protein
MNDSETVSEVRKRARINEKETGATVQPTDGTADDENAELLRWVEELKLEKHVEGPLALTVLFVGVCECVHACVSASCVCSMCRRECAERAG